MKVSTSRDPGFLSSGHRPLVEQLFRPPGHFGVRDLPGRVPWRTKLVSSAFLPKVRSTTQRYFPRPLMRRRFASA